MIGKASDAVAVEPETIERIVHVVTTLVLGMRSRSAACWYNLLMAPLLLLASLTSHALSPTLGSLGASAGFVFGWVIQLSGHAFEGKAPELVSSPINTLIGPVMVARQLAQLSGLRRPTTTGDHD